MSTTTIELCILHTGYGFNYVDGRSWTRILRNSFILSLLFFVKWHVTNWWIDYEDGNVPGTLTRKVINLTKNVTHFSSFSS